MWGKINAQFRTAVNSGGQRKTFIYLHEAVFHKQEKALWCFYDCLYHLQAQDIQYNNI